MKKLALLAFLITGVMNAQGLRFAEKEYFTTSLAVDFSASIKEKGVNFITEIEYVHSFMYIKFGVQSFSVLEGGYIDHQGGAGLNLTSGYFNKVRYYAGGKVGTVRRGTYNYPIAGLEAGIDYSLTETFFIGLKATSDYREDFKFSGADPKMRNSGFARAGFKF